MIKVWDIGICHRTQHCKSATCFNLPSSCLPCTGLPGCHPHHWCAPAAELRTAPRTLQQCRHCKSAKTSTRKSVDTVRVSKLQHCKSVDSDTARVSKPAQYGYCKSTCAWHCKSAWNFNLTTYETQSPGAS